MNRQPHAHDRALAGRQWRRAACQRADPEVHRTGGLLAGVDRDNDVEHAGRGHILVQDDGGLRGRARAGAAGNRGDESVRRGGCGGGDECQRSDDSQRGSPQSHTVWIGPNLERCDQTCAAWTRVRARRGRVRERPVGPPRSARGSTNGPPGSPHGYPGVFFTPSEVRFQPASTPTLALVWSWANLHEFVTEALCNADRAC